MSCPKFFHQFNPRTSIINSTKTESGKTQSLAFICDDTCYIWVPSGIIVKALCPEIWRSDDVDIKQEEWSLSTIIPFQVTHISVRKYPKEICILWGPFGAAAVTFSSQKKQKRIADCVILGEKTYLENPSLSIVQAKWHPTQRQSILMILNNDNFIRSYNVSDPDAIASITCAGSLNSVPFRYNETADPPVDFDFGPHLGKADYWTIFILKSSGILSYHLMRFIGSTSRSMWEDERLIPLEGGVDEVFELPTAISVSNDFPLLITIGGLGGSLYHSILLPFDTEGTDAMNLEDNLISGDTVLFVKEIVVLEQDMQLNFLQIIPDPLCPYRYACVHDDGVHLVTVNFFPHMFKLLTNPTFTEDPYVDTSATCRYILCCMDDKKKQNGFISATFSDSIPQKFVTMTGRETLVYDVPKFLKLTFPKDHLTELTPNTKSKLNPIALDALENVTNILAKTAHQPYLSCPPDLSQEKKEQIIQDSIRRIQNEYIVKQEQAMKFLSKAILNLIDRVEELKQPLASLYKVQTGIRAKAEELAEKYEEQNDFQHKLFKRFQDALSKYHRSSSIITDEEKSWAKKFNEYEAVIPQLKEQVNGFVATLQSMKARRNGNEDGGIYPKRKISAMELLELKREIIEHQKSLAELTQSVQQISGNGNCNSPT